MIIAIDGPAGTGKSTVAKGVASRLGFTFFDTGSMYRSIAWFALQEGISPEEKERVIALLPHFCYEVELDPKKGKKYFVNGREVTEAIRSQEISSLASQIAVIPEVREAMVKIQRRFGGMSDAVFEGRDMGTVVFPQADLKIFLTAKPEVRAERRYKELMAKFPDLADSLNYEQILQDIAQRDHADMNRAVSPLKAAEDAVVIDTSHLTAEQVIDRIVKLKKKIKVRYPPMKWPYWIVYHLARAFFRLFFRLKIQGIEHFRPGPGIIAANHVSLYDPEVVSISCPEEVHFLAKDSLFRIPLLGKLIRVLNAHPVSRDASDAATFRLIVQLLQSGKKVIIFPEGNRSYDGQLQPLQKGLPFLMQRAKCPVYPVFVKGTFEAWPRTRKIPKFWGKVTCTFGKPIEWNEFADLDKKEAMEKINERTANALAELSAQ